MGQSISTKINKNFNLQSYMPKSSGGMSVYRPAPSTTLRPGVNVNKYNSAAGLVQLNNNLKPVSQTYGQNLTVKDDGLLKTKQTPAAVTSTATGPANPPVNPTGFGTQPSVSAITQQNQNNNTALNQNNNTNNSNPPAPNTIRGLFPSVIGSLVGASTTTDNQKRLLKRLEDEAGKNRAIGDEAKRISDTYANEIARVGKLGAGAIAGDLSTGSNVVGSGNAAIASQSASSRMQSLSDAQQAALQGTAQQFTGQRQLTDTLGQANNFANTQQSQQITGLSSAGSLAQPNPAAYGQTVFDPTTGQYTDGGTLNPQNQAQQVAQAVMSGRMTYEQALATMGYAGNAGTTFLNNALTAQGGNPLQLQAQGAAQQANITTSGTAQTDIARQGLSTAIQDYVQLTNYAQAAGQQAHDLLNIMNTANVNGTPLIRANKTINTIANEVSDPNIKAFQTALVESRNLYARLLSTGGSTPTANDERAMIALDGNATPQATAAAIQQLENSVQNILSAQQGAIQQYQNNLGGNQFNSSSQGGSYGGSISWDNIF